MRRWFQLIVISAPMVLAACEARDGAAAEPAVPVDGERQPAPVSEPAPATEAPVVSQPAEASATKIALANAETRYNDLRERAAKLRDAVDQLGEAATQEMKDERDSMVKNLEVLEQRYLDLGAATESNSADAQKSFTESADTLDASISSLGAKMP